MRKAVILVPFLLVFMNIARCQQKATIREYKKTFTTYPFSDPDPVPDITKIYPYYRFDGFTDDAIQKEWKVVELENEFLKIMILPEVGGKVWAAIEKSTGKSFIYYNHVVKFRDVAMRGPWTSGGIEANYGIIGHTPNCATPVDYTIIEKKDGSVSCVVGVLDLLTRTSWRIDINLPSDKAYFTTGSFWYNSSPFEQPYYTWMNTGIKAAGNLEFIYPGTNYLGHEGEYSSWPVNEENGKNISFYENNDFGTYKSYHVFGKYTEFFGGYWHDENFGMGRYSTHDDKAGKKIWIWGLSQQGMIWDKLLTDTGGQYVEVQSGRLFNQSSEGSTMTPFKHRGFSPHATDTWIESWFPVLATKGFVAANNYGALNIINENGWLKIYFSPLQNIHEELKIMQGDKVIYLKTPKLKTLQLFVDSIKISQVDDLVITLGGNKFKYETSTNANVLNRPIQSPAKFEWTSVYGLSVQAKENIRQRHFALAEDNLKACLKKDSNYLPALTDYAMLLYRNMQYPEALECARRALSIDTYDPAANYYYGLINVKLGNEADAKDGFDIASMGMEFRSAAYNELTKIYFKENNLERATGYAIKCLDFNRHDMDALQLLALIDRLQNNHPHASGLLDTILQYDPLNHFALFEKYATDSSEENKKNFTGMVRNELPAQTYLELATWYYNIGRMEEAKKILHLSPSNAEVKYWLAFLENKPLDVQEPDQLTAFPFRPETAEVLQALITRSDQWLLKYHLALIQWNCNNINAAKKLFEQCAQQPAYAPFYAAKSRLFIADDTARAVSSLKYAMQLDQNEWRYGRAMIHIYLAQKKYDSALKIATDYRQRLPHNYIIGMQYIKTLLLNKKYIAANAAIKTIKILPNEGATDGRALYKEIQLMLALEEMQKKNYQSALNYLSAARQWPENLGVGKPYENEIDERLEDWLSYQNHVKLNNKKRAGELLDKITTFTNAYGRKNSPSPNDLVAAWAMRQKGQELQGKKYIQDALQKDPKSKIANWVLDAYNGKIRTQPAAMIDNENYRILEKWIQSTEKK